MIQSKSWSTLIIYVHQYGSFLDIKPLQMTIFDSIQTYNILFLAYLFNGYMPDLKHILVEVLWNNNFSFVLRWNKTLRLL